MFMSMYVYWAVTYTKNNITYYLNDINDNASLFVWTMKKDKAKRYGTSPAAMDMLELIKKAHKTKKAEFNLTQV